MIKYIIFIILSYLVGSIPFSYITAKVLGQVDIRNYGSGNSGATNVFRVLGKKAGAIAFLGDFFKGLIVAIVSKYYLGFDFALICSLFAVIGHCYPFALGFKGGKGVATTGGTIFGLYPLVGVILLISQILIIKVSRIMSLASISVAILLPIIGLLLGASKNFIIYGIILGCFVIYKHKANIKRLLNGTESKILSKK